MKGPCKSEFCVICRNFMGFVDGKPLCRILDEPPCGSFDYNGSPKPDAPKGCRSTELTNEYLLALANKRNDRDN